MSVHPIGPPKDRATNYEVFLGEIRAELARQKLKGTEVARRMGIVQQTFSRLTTGRTPMTVEQLMSLAEAIDIHPAVLLGGYAPGDPRGGGTVSFEISARSSMDRASDYGSLVRQSGATIIPFPVERTRPPADVPAAAHAIVVTLPGEAAA